MSARLACLLAVLIPLSGVLSPRRASASLLVDLRAVSGSGVTFQSTKSVIVTAASVGGVIDFEMWGVVRGSNADISDEALSTIAGSVLTTQFGRGGVSGSLLNTGEIAPEISRGVTADFPSPGTSAGKLQNLDDDPDLEIGGAVAADLMVARRSPTLGLLRDTDGGMLAEFLVYRFSLPITSILARDAMNDYTIVEFEQYRIQPLSARWHEDDRPKNPRVFLPEWFRCLGAPPRPPRKSAFRRGQRTRARADNRCAGVALPCSNRLGPPSAENITLGIRARFEHRAMAHCA